MAHISGLADTFSSDMGLSPDGAQTPRATRPRASCGGCRPRTGTPPRKAFGWDVAGSHGVIVNLTAWQSVEALAGFALSGRHLQIMRQRQQWFHRAAEATTAL